MAELVLDPGFDIPAKWIVVGGGGITVESSQLQFNNGAGAAYSNPAIVPVIGLSYRYVVDVDTWNVSATVGQPPQLAFGGETFHLGSLGTGLFYGHVTATTTNNLQIAGSLTGQWYINSISLEYLSVRESIIRSLDAQLKEITTANNYEINVKTTARSQRTFEDEDLPAIGIFDGVESSVSQYNMTTNEMDVAVDMHSDALTENRSIHANKMLASIKKGVLSGDTEHGGYASRTSIDNVTVNIPQDDDDTHVGVSVTFKIMYEEITGNPYSSP